MHFRTWGIREGEAQKGIIKARRQLARGDLEANNYAERVMMRKKSINHGLFLIIRENYFHRFHEFPFGII